MNTKLIFDKLRELKTKRLAKRKYVFKKKDEIFEDLCIIHDYLVKNNKPNKKSKKYFEIKNEFLVILEDIIIEIFMPLRPEEKWVKYPQGVRYYWLASDTAELLSKTIYELNPLSTIWLTDLSMYYDLKSKKYKWYNFNKNKSKLVFSDVHIKANMRIKIREHLQIYKDPNKPKKPEEETPESLYEYNFLSALYEEDLIKNRFFQEMKYQPFYELEEEGAAILNLKVVNFWEEEYNFEENKPNVIGMILVPEDEGKLLAKYNLFKEDTNPFIHIFRTGNEKEILNQIFITQNSEFEGEIISINEEQNSIKLKIKTKNFEVKHQKSFISLVLREDPIVQERERKALKRLIRRNYANKELKKIIINKELNESFNDVKVNNWCLPNLTESQKIGVENALRAKSLYCFHGPPGTGKTRGCTATILQQIYFNPKSRILVTCASNEATDNILNSVKEILPKELYPLILKIGTELKTEDNPHSLTYKVKNSMIYSNTIVEIEKEIIGLEKDIEKRESYMIKVEAELKISSEKRDKLEKELLDFKRDEAGNILRGEKKGRTGVLFKIELLESSYELKSEEDELIQLKNKKIEIDEKIEDCNLKIDALEDKMDIHQDKLNALNEKRIEKQKELKNNRQQIKDTVLNRQPIIIFSTNNNSDALKNNFENNPFDLLVIDEITQSTEPSSLIPINLSKKVVTAGDYHQLPPTVFLKNKNYDEEIDPEKAKDRVKSYKTLARSIFERLTVIPNIKEENKYYSFFETQFRMHKTIIPFLNKTIYQKEKLYSDPSVEMHEIKKGYFGNPLVFINHNVEEKKTSSSEEFNASKIEYTNPEEIRIVKKVVEKFLSSGMKKEDIGVISPYKAQVREINKAIEEYGIVAKTIDSFQGQQKNVIILSLVRSNPSESPRGGIKSPTERIGFLVDERRFCVGITRFKYKLIVIGNEKTLSLSNSSEQSYYDIYEEKEKYIYYKQFIDFVKKKGRYIDGVSELNKLLAKTNVDLKIKKSKVDKKRNLDFAKKLVEKVYESNVANLKKEIVKLEKNSKNKKINEKLLKNYKSLDSKDLGKALELNGILKVLVEE